MLKKYFKIGNIPTILWGDSSEKVFIAIHGNTITVSFTSCEYGKNYNQYDEMV